MKDKIESYLQSVWEGAERVEVRDFAPILGGYSCETFRFDAHVQANGETRVHELILRKDPDVEIGGLGTSRQLEHEILEALAGQTGIPVCRSFFVEMDPEVFGKPAMIIERVRGSGAASALFPDGKPTAEARAIATQLCEMIAELHTTPPEKLNASGRFHDPRGWGFEAGDWDSYMERTIDWYLHRYEEVKFESLPIFYDALLTLRREKPRPLPLRMVHGDFNPGNFLYEDGKVTLLYDWEFAHMGDPREDLGYLIYMDALTGTDIFGAVEEDGGFLGHYNKLTGFNVRQAEVDYFLMFTAMFVCLPALHFVKRRTGGESEELFHLYVIQPQTLTFNMFARLLGYPLGG